MKNILILNYEYPPLGGGAATATQNLLREYSRNSDYNFTLLTTAVGGYREEQISQNVKIVFLDIGKNSNLHNQSMSELIKYSIKATNWIKKNVNNFDMIHAFFGTPCGYLAMRAKLPYIVSLRGSDVPFYSKKYKLLDSLLFQHLDKKIWGKASFVVANSEGLKELALKTYSKKTIEVIYNGVDCEYFKPATERSNIPQQPNDNVKKRPFTVISTSRLIERKGIDLLIRGFANFSENKDYVKLVIIGDGKQKQIYMDLAKSLDTKEKIIFLGESSKDTVASELRKSDVFVLPSLNEGMSNSLLEAMASGLAVICTNVGGTKELVNETNGIIIEKNNYSAIQEGLEKLYLDENLLRSMKSSSRKKAESLNWSTMAQQYLQLYKLTLTKSK